MLKLISRSLFCAYSINKRYFHKAVTLWIVLNVLHVDLLLARGNSPPPNAPDPRPSPRNVPENGESNSDANVPRANGKSLKAETITLDENSNQRSADDNESPTPPLAKTEFTPLELYRKLFQQKRQSQVEAVKSIVKLGGYEKQYKMMTLLLEKMVAILTESKSALISLGFTPGDPFPESEQTREVLSRVAENTAFFGDLLLRLPDITHSLLKKNKEWDLVAKWAVGYCNDTKIMGDAEQTLLNLVGQELELIPTDPNYRNPHKLDQGKQNKKIKDELQSLLNEHTGTKSKPEKKTKREKLKKGPRLSNIRHSEL